MEWLKKIPVLGAIAGDGIKSSEGVMLGSLIAIVTAKDITLPTAIAIAGIGIGIGGYAIARGGVKGIAAKEAA